MPERATIFQTVQIGLEQTAGTRKAATKKLSSIGIEPNIKLQTRKFRPMGTKHTTIVVPNKEWSEAKVSGEANYNELAFLWASIVKLVTPTGGGAAKTWTFDSNSSGPDTVATFSVEQGDNSTHAHGGVYNVLKDLSLKFDREQVSIDGAMIGRKLSDDIVITTAPVSDVQRITLGNVSSGTFIVNYITSAGATQSTTGQAYNVAAATLQSALEGLAGIGAGNIAVTRSGSGTTLDPYLYTCTFQGTLANTVQNLFTITSSLNAGATATVTHVTFGADAITSPTQQIVLPTELSVYLDTSSGNLGTTKLTRVLSGEWSLTDRFGPLWTVDAAQDSWAQIIETEPNLMAKLLLEADDEALSSSGQNLLAIARAGTTRWLRIEAVGPLITGSDYYQLRIDMPVKIKEPKEFTDQDGVFALEFEFEGVHDQTWGKAYQVTLVNTLASL